MAHTCRGSISLHGAVIHTEDSCNFVISNGGTQTFHLKASSEVERQRWVTALELAKVKAIRDMESGWSCAASFGGRCEQERRLGKKKFSDLVTWLPALFKKNIVINTCF